MDVLREETNIRDFAHGDFGIRAGTGNMFFPEIGEYIDIETHGGEDQGTDWWRIKYFPDHDVYIKVDGEYSSYEGTEFYGGWACCHEVRPKEKMIIAYEKV